MKIILTLLEALTISVGLLSMKLNMERKAISWLLNIAVSLMSIFTYCMRGEYSRFFISFVTIFFSIYGWKRWKTPQKNHRELPITRLSKKEVGGLLLSVLLMWYPIHLLLIYTSSSLPLVGTLLVTLSWAGMWLSANRKLEAPLCWMLYNILSIYQNQLIGTEIHMLKSLLYALLSPYTFFLWKRVYEKERKEEAEERQLQEPSKPQPKREIETLEIENVSSD